MDDKWKELLKCIALVIPGTIAICAQGVGEAFAMICEAIDNL